MSGAAAIPGAQAPATDGTQEPANAVQGSASAADTGAAFAQALGLQAVSPGAASGTDAQPTDHATAVSAGAAEAVGNVGAGRVTGLSRASAASKPADASAAGRAMQAAGRRITAANSASPEVNAGADDATASANAAPPADGATAAPTAAALAMSAAANSAVVPGVAAVPETASSAADDSSTTVADSTGQQAAGSAGLPPSASAVSPVVATAAKAPASLSAVTALTNAGAPDKHVRGGNSDSLAPATAGAVPGSAPSSVGAGPADAAQVPTLKVAAGVDTAEFGQGVADRVSYMVDNNLNGAKLQVNPPQLGPIEVRIAVQGDHAQVWLTSHSAVTRDALESSSPKLREMLGSQGFGQVSVDISQRSFQERPSQAQTYDWTPSAERGASAAQTSAAAPLSRISSGAVDAYA